MQINNQSETQDTTFNLLNLHKREDKSTQSWIYASGEDLQNVVKRLLPAEKIEDILEHLKVEGMASYRKQSKTVVYMKKLISSINNDVKIKWFPLALLVYISKKTDNHIKFTMKIDKLGSIKNNYQFAEINAVKSLDINLAKLLGIHAGDGSVSGYTICIKEGDYYNLVLIRDLFKEIFGISPALTKIKTVNAWKLEICNKVISRYFVEIFGFKNGYKTDIVRMPEIIRNSEFEAKQAFVSGVLMSDGYASYDGKIRLSCKSKELVEDVMSVLLEDGLKISTIRNSIHGKKSIWYFSSFAPSTTSEVEKLKWLKYFDVNSEKWYKIKECVFGSFDGKVSSYKAAEKLFSRTYVGGNNSKIKVTDVIKISEQLGKINNKQLANILQVSTNTAEQYTKLLTKTNILKAVKAKKSLGVGKGSSPIVYSFNRNISEWKVPYRPTTYLKYTGGIHE